MLGWTRKSVGFICPFVVDDPTDLGAIIVVAQALCLSIFNLSPTSSTYPLRRKPAFLPKVIKLTCLSGFRNILDGINYKKNFNKAHY